LDKERKIKMMGTYRDSKLKKAFLKSFCLIFILLFLTTGFVTAEDRRSDKTKLCVMTLNAEFLWDGVEPEEGQVNFPWKFSQTEAEEHMRKVAELIISGNPDIVNLVEVENINALRTLNDKFLSGHGYIPYLINGKDYYTGQDVALLTRIDPDGNLIQRDDRDAQKGNVRKSVSKNYYAKIIVDNTKIALIGLHFLAQPNREDRRLQREAQAEVIRRLASELQAEGYKVIVMGDFNDYDGDENSKDHINSTPISAVLQIVRSMDPNDPSDDLINVASLLAKPNRYTAFWDANDNGIVDFPNELTSIDHILVSPQFKNEVDTVEIPHNHDPRQVTDHFPVKVCLKIGEAPSPPMAVRVRIASLLPNPEGDETQNEEIIIKNLGTQPVNLANWTTRDLSKKTWLLDELGTINPGEEKTIRRKGQKMSLNNDGDTIELVDPSGKVVQTVTYSRAEEGELIKPVID
jgi:endonuclease/exonuclease/phosphatase family metal-dependent hydrolase